MLLAQIKDFCWMSNTEKTVNTENTDNTENAENIEHNANYDFYEWSSPILLRETFNFSLNSIQTIFKL